MTISIQVIKTYEVEVENVDQALRLTTSQIETQGNLTNVETNYAEEVE